MEKFGIQLDFPNVPVWRDFSSSLVRRSGIQTMKHSTGCELSKCLHVDDADCFSPNRKVSSIVSVPATYIPLAVHLQPQLLLICPSTNKKFTA
eukprot:scaffold26782_cov51-Attheya_sp.AAC.5